MVKRTNSKVFFCFLSTNSKVFFINDGTNNEQQSVHKHSKSITAHYQHLFFFTLMNYYIYIINATKICIFEHILFPDTGCLTKLVLLYNNTSFLLQICVREYVFKVALTLVCVRTKF